eukprot:6743116-Pyramimonas_sp.AAC.1
MKPRCSPAIPGAICGSMQSWTALQISRLSAFVMLSGLVLALRKPGCRPLSRRRASSAGGPGGSR